MNPPRPHTPTYPSVSGGELSTRVNTRCRHYREEEELLPTLKGAAAQGEADCNHTSTMQHDENNQKLTFIKQLLFSTFVSITNEVGIIVSI